jgi:sarcosine oxidase/L-pipecolate oxidase
MGSVRETYLIVGAGLFGASTALHLKRSSPSAVVILLDRTPFPCPSGAAYDLNKIIRAGYDDIFYVKLALEAQKMWRSDPIYQPFYHECGMLFSEYWGMGRAAFGHYKTIGEDFDAEMTTPEAAKARFPMFRDGNWDDVSENFFDARAGWADAAPCLRRLIQAATDEGVTYKAAHVSTISIVQGTCTGVRLKNGQELKADHVLLCTGAYTAKLLADSAPADKELQVNDRLVAAAAVTCAAKLTPEQMEKFKDVPVYFNGMGHTRGKDPPASHLALWAGLLLTIRGATGECIPPTSDGMLKFTNEASFVNMVHHKESNQYISVPPNSVRQSTWSQDVPEGLKQEVRTVMRHMYGKEIEGIEPECYRMCW